MKTMEWSPANVPHVSAYFLMYEGPPTYHFMKLCVWRSLSERYAGDMLQLWQIFQDLWPAHGKKTKIDHICDYAVNHKTHSTMLILCPILLPKLNMLLKEWQTQRKVGCIPQVVEIPFRVLVCHVAGCDMESKVRPKVLIVFMTWQFVI
jgi:hypothetical protein